jgi:hypothetical protein
MVKIFVRNEKLYMEKGEKNTQISSATIEHNQKEAKYYVSAFVPLKYGTKTVSSVQKSYPLVDIKLTDTNDVRSGMYKSFYNARGKNWYINYYVV